MMYLKPFKWFGCFFAFASLTISCTGTDITQEEVTEAYNGKPVSNIFVIAITGNEHNRHSYEKKFVAHLKAAGVGGVASVDVIPMPPDLVIKKETILTAVNQYGNDAVIITHLTGKKVKDVVTRSGARNRGFYGYYMSARDPGYTSTSTTLRLETSLYDVKTERLIWSASSKTLSRDASDQTINEVIKTVIGKMQKNKLIAPKLVLNSANADSR